jgi:hypothetical protein
LEEVLKMNILFLTLAEISNIDQGGIYPDLMNFFVGQGHHVTIMSPIERKHNMRSSDTEYEGFRVIRVKTLNIQKTNLLEKSLGTLTIDYLFSRAVKSLTSLGKVDILLYSTPPITFVKTIETIKNKFNPYTYLLLKDIFPQNAVDLGFMKKNGLIYKYFRMKEKKLYNLSDGIGCMSQANVDYLRKHNPYLNPVKIEICPNSIKPQDSIISEEKKLEIRKKFGLPLDRTIFIYGGNLGKPQDVDFIIQFLERQINNKEAYYIIAGSGTEYPKISKWLEKSGAENIELHPYLPKAEYDDKLKCSNVGLIFLNDRFTIPNYPSRLLPYIDNGLPTIAAVDPNTDIGTDIENNDIGKWSLAGDLDALEKNINFFCSLTNDQKDNYAKRCREFLSQKATVQYSGDIILNSYLRRRN